MQELTAQGEKVFAQTPGAIVDLLHPGDKAEVSEAFFDSIGSQKAHCYVSVRIREGGESTCVAAP